ncbi:MAG: transcription-repair coupling factor [Ruminococcaceae bacterium]|nr:transcription-repair coupling factor [Oscillospiraceae bacterium]
MQTTHKFIRQMLLATPEYAELTDAFRSGRFPAAIWGASHIHRCILSAALSIDFGSKPLIITPGDAETERVLEDLTALGADCAVFPARDYLLRPDITRSHDWEHKRLGTLSKILERDFDVVLASADAVLGRTLPKETLQKRLFELKVGDELAQTELIDHLVAAGFTRSEQVDGAGQFSVRGSIIDLFTPDRNDGIRIDFFGDEIDSISVFEIDTQRRTESLKSVKITPVSEVSPDDLVAFREKLLGLTENIKTHDTLKKRIKKDLNRLENGGSPSLDAYIDLIYSDRSTIFDYLGENSPVFIFDTNAVLEKAENCLDLHFEELKALLEEGVLPKGFKSVYLDLPLFSKELGCRKTVFFDTFPKSQYPIEPKSTLNLNFKQSNGFSGSATMLADDIKNSGARLTVILAGTEKAANNLCEELCDLKIKAKFAVDPSKVGKSGVYVTTGLITAGFELPSAKASVIVHGKATAAKRKRRFKTGNAVGSLDELTHGDYVVHATHGIGVFEGIQQMKTHGITRDYIKIRYAGKDALYVPVTSLDLVSKYVGNSDDVTVKLNKLGSQDWNKTRARVKSAVKDMAKQLTALYAKRMQIKGYAFSPDTDMQSDFERRFEFEETDDQLRCVAEIKRDMERSVPMDRLLCGDVGFGKTEVALRAAFKCIAEGKQCAILVPTTILAWQHYNTAVERFSGVAVNVEMLSRFRTPKQQEKIKKDLIAGNIDLIIGTHSLIAKDVKFKDLGLLIVDEEQRFGVAQKEKLKERFPDVDALTLSATPIPRTLNMALSGLRDMSSIEEAPMNRHPVQTYVLEQDKGIVNEAISRELRRGGQVYYLHNRTDSIDSCALKLQQAHPDAKVGVAHGKLGEEALSRVWQQLLEKEIDILVCTTIIETGVDVPNANTLIIEDADRLGLAQLHQIRGRVGRSHRMAYAYLLFTRGKALSDISQKRLDAISKFTEFGSGFRIAMRDLEIRGAGSVLGGEQHGHLEAVGYDMYLKLLSDAIAEEKGEVPEKQLECTVDLKLNAHIPERYISSLSQRLSAYRRIAAIKTHEDVLDVTDELLDRYGDLPKAVETLIDVSFLKNRAAAAGITEITEQMGILKFYLEGLNDRVTALLTSPLQRRVMFNAGSRPFVGVKLLKQEPILETLRAVLDAMQP